MIDNNNTTGDSPPNWEEYQTILQEHAQPDPASQRQGAMLSRLNTAIAGGGRVYPASRRFLASSLAVATIVILLVFGFGSGGNLSRLTSDNAVIQAKQDTETRRPARRNRAKRLQPPTIPDMVHPPSVDTVIPHGPFDLAPMHPPVIPGRPTPTTGDGRSPASHRGNGQ